MRKLMSLSRRTIIIAIAALLTAVTAAAAFASSAGAAPARHADTASSCGLATLHGSYLFAGDGWSVGSTTTPLAFAGSEQFDGAGHVRGISTSSFNGAITRGSAFTGAYTVAANCTGTLTIATTLHFDLYIAPSGNIFKYAQTDPGSVSATTEERVGP
jgi:hypothetical protein